MIKTSFAFEELFAGEWNEDKQGEKPGPSTGKRFWMEKDGIEQGLDAHGITQSLGFADLGSPLMSGFLGGFHGLSLGLSEFPRDGGRRDQAHSFPG